MSTKLVPVTLSKAITTSGTPEALSASALRVVAFSVQSKTGNTGTVHIGDSTVDNSTKPGMLLTEAQLIAFPPKQGFYYDLADVYVDVSVNGEGVDVTYWVSG